MLPILGGAIFLWGLVDMVGSWGGFDLWGTIGVQLPDIVWQYSAYIALIVGGILFSMGGRGDEEDGEA